MHGRLLAMLLKEFRQLAADWPIVLILLWGFFGAVYLSGHAGASVGRRLPLARNDGDRFDPARKRRRHEAPPKRDARVVRMARRAAAQHGHAVCGDTVQPVV